MILYNDILYMYISDILYILADSCFQLVVPVLDKQSSEALHGI